MKPSWHIVHQISDEQIRALESVFAKGSVVDDKIVWTFPLWLEVLKNTPRNGATK